MLLPLPQSFMHLFPHFVSNSLSLFDALTLIPRVRCGTIAITAIDNPRQPHHSGFYIYTLLATLSKKKKKEVKEAIERNSFPLCDFICFCCDFVLGTLKKKISFKLSSLSKPITHTRTSRANY